MALINGVNNTKSHGISEPPKSKEAVHLPTTHTNWPLGLESPPPGHKPIDNRVPDAHATVLRSGISTTVKLYNQPQHMAQHTTTGSATPGPVPVMPRTSTFSKESVRTHDQQIGVVPAPPASQKTTSSMNSLKLRLATEKVANDTKLEFLDE